VKLIARGKAYGMKPTKLETPCIEWLYSLDGQGYGRVYRDGVRWRVHRLAWTDANGPIPEGMCVLHRCDNPACFRLEHLFLGTRTDNATDRARKGRGRGNPNGQPKKITDAQAEMIKRVPHKRHAMKRAIAGLGITLHYAYEIRRGKRRPACAS